GLAKRGHDVHVVTNAKEVGPLHRMHMRPEDWARCEQSYGAGSVRVHWSDQAGGALFHIPEGNPFVTKLASIAVGLHAQQPFDAILSYYLEPYAVSGYLASQITGVPNIVRMAGSDAGRLWRQPQLEAVYDHVLRSAAFAVTGRVVAARAPSRPTPIRRSAIWSGAALPAIGPISASAASSGWRKAPSRCCRRCNASCRPDSISGSSSWVMVRTERSRRISAPMPRRSGWPTASCSCPSCRIGASPSSCAA